MKTQLIKIDADNFKMALEAAEKTILDGGVVGMPTETVYGLAANAYNELAVKKIFEAKARPQDNPLIVHICDYVMLNDVVAEVPESAIRLAKQFWPGPLTMIMPKSNTIPGMVTCGLPTVAVRMPSHHVALTLIRESGVPIAAPSANLSGAPSTTTAQHVYEDLNGRIPLILDGGPCEIGIESTVISLTGERPSILRPGIISLTEIQEVLPDAVVAPEVFRAVGADEKVSSPGLKHKHYSPSASVIVIEGSSEQFVAYVNAHAEPRAFALCFFGEQNGIEIPSVAYGGKDDIYSQAHMLFSAFRTLDRMSASVIYAHAPAETDQSLGVLNRMVRAAGFTVVRL